VLPDPEAGRSRVHPGEDVHIAAHALIPAAEIRRSGTEAGVGADDPAVAVGVAPELHAPPGLHGVVGFIVGIRDPDAVADDEPVDALSGANVEHVVGGRPHVAV